MSYQSLEGCARTTLAALNPMQELDSSREGMFADVRRLYLKFAAIDNLSELVGAPGEATRVAAIESLNKVTAGRCGDVANLLERTSRWRSWHNVAVTSSDLLPGLGRLLVFRLSRRASLPPCRRPRCVCTRGIAACKWRAACGR